MNKETRTPFILSLCLAGLFPLTLRLLLIGGPPCTDEGIYAFWAQMIFHSLTETQQLPQEGGLLLYPTLTNWIFSFNIPAIFGLRVIDAVFASLLGLTFFSISFIQNRQISLSLLLSLLCSFIINDQVLVNYGYKNSIIVALIPLLWSFHILLQDRKSPRRLFLSGVLVAVATMLREPFVIFSILGTLNLLLRRNLRGFSEFVAGGLTAFLLTLLLFAFAGKTPSDIIAAYVLSGKLFTKVNHDIWEHLVSALHTAGMISLPLWPYIILLLGGMIKVYREGTKLPAAHILFWSLVIFSPAAEVFGKIGFPYHFTVTIVGLWGLIVTLAPFLTQTAGKKLLVATAVLAGIFTIPRMQFLKEQYILSKKFSPVIISDDWKSDAVNDSTHLVLADYIRDHATPKDTLMVSGAFFVLFPLTKLHPLNPNFADLDWMQAAEVDIDGILRDTKPDFIVVAERNTSGFSNYKPVISQIEGFAPIFEVNIDNRRFYGTWGASIWSPHPKSEVPRN